MDAQNENFNISTSEMADIDQEIEDTTQQNLLNENLNDAVRDSEDYISEDGDITTAEHIEDLIAMGAVPDKGTALIAAISGQTENIIQLSKIDQSLLTDRTLLETISSGNVATARQLNNMPLQSSELNSELPPNILAIKSLNPEMTKFVENEMGIKVQGYNGYNPAEIAVGMATGQMTLIDGAAQITEPLNENYIPSDETKEKISELTEKLSTMLDYLHDKGHDVKGSDTIDALKNSLKHYPESLEKINTKLEALNTPTKEQVKIEFSADVQERLEQFNQATGQNWQYAPETENIYHVLPSADLALNIVDTIKSSNLNNISLIAQATDNDGGGLVNMDAQSFMSVSNAELNLLASKLSEIKIPDSHLAAKPEQSNLQESFHIARDGEITPQAAKNDETYTQTLAM